MELQSPRRNDGRLHKYVSAGQKLLLAATGIRSRCRLWYESPKTAAHDTPTLYDCEEMVLGVVEDSHIFQGVRVEHKHVRVAPGGDFAEFRVSQHDS